MMSKKRTIDAYFTIPKAKRPRDCDDLTSGDKPMTLVISYNLLHSTLPKTLDRDICSHGS